MNNYSQIFKIDGDSFVLLGLAKGIGEKITGKVAIIRNTTSKELRAIPINELMRYSINKDNHEALLSNRLALYKKRFVGREDVYAHRYFNKRLGKYMYSPVVPFKDRKPILNQWISLSDRELENHLIGTEFLGFYPMFPDNTTKYLVLDIDGHHQGDEWRQITSSLQAICNQYSIPHLTELSQSGHGCHIWIFFDAPLSASSARRLGDAILKATMAINPNLSFTAFDRMFPSQDFISKDKIGNLIAGPLQGDRRRENKSVFVDDSYRPLPDQWKALAEVQLISSKKLNIIVNTINENSQFQFFNEQDKQSDLLKEPSIINKPLTIIRNSAILIPKAGLSVKQVNQLKWLCSFKNPIFYEKQNKRMSLYNTPRIISLFQETPKHIVIPRGLEQEILNLFPHSKWIDKTVHGNPIHVEFKGELHPEQLRALESLVSHSDGILSARTGFGKTVVAAQLIAKLNISTLILVHDKEIAKQWITQLNKFLIIADEPFVHELTPTGRVKRKAAIGSYFGTKHNRSGIVDVATIQSFKNDKASTEILDQYGLVISDEVHHDAAFTFEQVIKAIKSKYLFGLSATPFRRDGQDPIILMRFGPVRYQTSMVDEKTVTDIKRIIIPRFTTLGITNLAATNYTINENYESMLKDGERNQSIVQDIKSCFDMNRHILVLTKRIAHVEILAGLLGNSNHLFLLYGNQTDKENIDTIKTVNESSDPYILLATNKYAGEGLDIPSIDTLVLAMPHSWKGNSIQYIGRTQRNLAQKSEIRIYDYVDMFIPMLARMYRKRLKTYHDLHYKVLNDKYSQQKGINFYDGAYHEDMVTEARKASDIFICENRLNSFIRDDIIPKTVSKKITMLLNSISASDKTLLRKTGVKYTLYDQNLPNVLVINKAQMWLSSDLGFSKNTGITVCINQPQLVEQFIKLLLQTVDNLV